MFRNPADSTFCQNSSLETDKIDKTWTKHWTWNGYKNNNSLPHLTIFLEIKKENLGLDPTKVSLIFFIIPIRPSLQLGAIQNYSTWNISLSARRCREMFVTLEEKFLILKKILIFEK